MPRGGLFDRDDDEDGDEPIDEEEMEEASDDEPQSYLEELADQVVGGNIEALEALDLPGTDEVEAASPTDKYEAWKAKHEFADFLAKQLMDTLVGHMVAKWKMQEDGRLSKWLKEFDKEEAEDAEAAAQVVMYKHKEEINVAIEKAIDRALDENDDDEEEE